MRIIPAAATLAAPPERFTGEVWVEPVSDQDAAAPLTTVGRVRFAPGARSAWHSHPQGRTAEEHRP